MYRYADGTPFPFEENFIDIMAAAVEACAAMFSAAADLEALRAKARDAKREADEEGRRLGALEKSVEAAVFPARPSAGKDATITQQTAQKMLASVKQAINASRLTLEKHAAAAAAEPRPERSAQQVHAAAARFFDRQHLPQTAWAWKWHGDGVAHGELTARSGKFAVIFDLELEGAWRGPVRVGALAAGVSALLPKKRMLGKPAPARVALDKCYLARATHDDGGHTLVVREHAAKSPGWRILMPRHGGVSCIPLDAAGKALGGEVEVGGDTSGLDRLVDAIDEALGEMRDRRKTREVSLGDVPLTAINDPTHAPRALLEQLAPTIRTIRARSTVHGELALKRDVADGRREEIFLPRAAVAAKYARLPAEYRKLFDELGLSRDDTSEIDERDLDERDLDTPATIPMVPTAGPGAPTMLLPRLPKAVA